MEAVPDPIEGSLSKVGVEEFGDLPGELGVVGARPREERFPFAGLARECPMQEFLDPPPACAGGLRSSVADPGHGPSARFNHARAAAQSRFTVAPLTPTVSAVSSTSIPANTRHSTTRT